MPLFGRKHTVLPIPEGFTAGSVRIESSICTGEKTIGFYDPASKRLMYAEAVRSDKDIESFLRRYGIQDKEK